MSDVEDIMREIKAKNNPDSIEILKYIRYAVNVKKYPNEKIIEILSHWDLGKIDSAIKKVEKENSAPRPKRYYVSLKKPLEDQNMR